MNREMPQIKWQNLLHIIINSVVTKDIEGAVQGVLRNSWSIIHSFKSPTETLPTVSWFNKLPKNVYKLPKKGIFEGYFPMDYGNFVTKI